MIAGLVSVAAIAVWAVGATVVVTARDGYRRLPTLERGPGLS